VSVELYEPRRTGPASRFRGKERSAETGSPGPIVMGYSIVNIRSLVKENGGAVGPEESLCRGSRTG